jgi:predicted aconitase
MRTLRLICVALMCAAYATFSGLALAQVVSVTPSDTPQSFIAAQKGKRISVRLRSGQELSGLVRDASAQLLVLGEVAGREFFDAVVPMASVEAVLIRTRGQ